ncbi:MAG TPA: GntR family transcriptional regulator [Rikenellaceae bacterium]|nr:GntR family transcriptional regulator [Rikenellaceae bacterium]HBH20976.1 GntR family transcriptional regulator [Rikenellaceae bacterium]HCZ21976.1 GntR family transcriptional regulator [Rikenellaceae bacterium]
MMEFDSNKPIYIQISDNICERILSGEFKPGDRIPSVREWGANIGVNPNTVARSYEVLSDRRVIFNQRGIGFFVSSDALDVIRNSERRKFIEEEVPAFKSRAALLGLEVKDLLL